MKKNSFLLATVFICGVFSINAQNIDTVKNKKQCYFEEHLKKQKLLDPTLESQIQAAEVTTQEWIKNNQDYLENSKATTIVPVVVHIVGTNASSAISNATVTALINAMNTDYAGQNPHSMESFPTNLKTNTNIQFCLAKRDPKGVATTGIERRTAGTLNEYTDDDRVKVYAQSGLDVWDPNKYLNIWVCYSSVWNGYGVYPSPIDKYFGLVVSYDAFGNSLSTNYGGTTTHEISHCFNIIHIWGDENGCAGSDNCGDTPNQAGYTSSNLSPTGVRTDACTISGLGIMYMNFMDYTNDSKSANFTPNQATRMQAALAGPLKGLLTSNGCTPVPGVEKNNFIQNVTIYPNPTNGELNINFSIVNPCDVNVSIYNILGEEIYSFNKNKTSVVNTNVDISNQSSGIYFVKIKTEKQFLTQKITLLK